MMYPELRDKCIELQRDCTEKQNELRRQYAAEHNPVKIGDIITDHYHTIRVENMSMYGHPVPYVMYTGIELTKQGEPKKRQPIHSARLLASANCSHSSHDITPCSICERRVCTCFSTLSVTR